MSHELVMDLSKEIFKLDKDILTFEIGPSIESKLSMSSLSHHSTDLKPLSEEELCVTNLTSDYLAFRTKTTKKEYYSVNPTYFILTPNGNQIIKFLFYNQSGKEVDPKGHKFRFEGFIILESEKDEDLKELFQKYIKSGKKVVGNVAKRYVKIIKENEVLSQDSNSTLSNSNLSNYSDLNEPKQNTLLVDKIQQKQFEPQNLTKMSEIIMDKSGGQLGGNSNREKLEKLKNEYNILKEQVDNLKRNEELLNQRFENEKNKKNNTQVFSDKHKYKVPEIKEKKMTKNYLIGIFMFSVLVGFYLAK
jgi:hypothetical protein